MVQEENGAGDEGRGEGFGSFELARPAPKPPELVPVKVVQLRKHAALVEWVIRREDGLPDLRRAEVPREVVHDNVVAYDDLMAGVPYGLPWEEIARVRITPDAIAAELRRLGVWTADDLASKPLKVTEAMQRVGGLARAGLLAAAKEYLKTEAKR